MTNQRPDSDSDRRFQLSSWRRQRWIAHRGAGRLAPENTLAAFRQGSACGFSAFECDVQLSSDGVAFLLHDEMLDRTTNGSGPAARRPWSELATLDAGAWHSEGFRGEPLASLSGVARYCIDHGCLLNIELKPSPGTDVTTGERVAADAARLWAHEARKPLLSSFSAAALAAARRAAHALPRALLLESFAPGWHEQAMALDCIGIVARHDAFDAQRVEALREAGWLVWAYTVNDEAAARALRAWGVDGLITDAVDGLPQRLDGAGRDDLNCGSRR